MLRIIVVLLAVTAALAENAERKVIADLMEKITEPDTVARPVANHGDAVDVKISLNINRILDIDEGVLKMSVYLYESWNDVNVKWDASNGVKVTRFPVDKLWAPDILAFDGHIDYGNKADYQAVVHADGKIEWVPMAKLCIPCHKEWTTKGEQFNCSIIVGSWVYSAAELNVDFKDKNDFETGDMFPSPKFELVSTTAVRTQMEYECCPGEEFVSLSYNIVVREKRHGWGAKSEL